MQRLLLTAAMVVPAVVLLAARTPDPDRKWFKGNLHTHTLWSDGNDFPEMVVDWYRSRGDYDFLALSDHNTLQQGERWMDNDLVIRRGGRTALAEYRARCGDAVETREGEDGKLEVRLRTLEEFRGAFEAPGEFLLIQSEELTASHDGAPIHINATNLGEVLQPAKGTSVAEVLRKNLQAILEQEARLGRPILAHLNHPNFGWAFAAEEMAEVLEERFFEVWNGHPSIHHLGDEQRASVEKIWDVVNALRIQQMGQPPLFGVGTDDSHNYHNESASIPGRGWVMVRAAELTPKALIEAMRAGDFYASSGVELADVRFEDGILEVGVAARAGETYRVEFVGTRKGVELAGEARTDGEGKALRTTRRYPDAVGEILSSHEVAGQGTIRVGYRLGDDELYVRCVVTSSAAPERPVWEGQKQQAWTQPMGWRRWL